VQAAHLVVVVQQQPGQPACRCKICRPFCKGWASPLQLQPQPQIRTQQLQPRMHLQVRRLSAYFLHLLLTFFPCCRGEGG
jgi:hypothetical protein